MGRIAALLILLSQILLLWVALEPSGTTAIWFMFAGHPLLGAGAAVAARTGGAVAGAIRCSILADDFDPARHELLLAGC